MSGLEPGRKAAIETRNMQTDGESGRVSRAKKGRQKVLGEQLKRVYQEVVNEAVPDEFMRLLEEADRNSKAEGAKR